MRAFSVITLSGLLSLLTSGAWAEAGGGPFGGHAYDCERVASGHIPCADRSEVQIKTGTYNFPTADFSWRCNEVFNSLYIDFFNSSKFQIKNLIIEGVNTGDRFIEELVWYVEPGDSGSLMTAMDHELCRNNENLELSFEFNEQSGGVWDALIC